MAQGPNIQGIRVSIPARCLALEDRIGYKFADRGLLHLALTHRSSQSATGNSEVLEFLGDRVLGLCVAEALTNRHQEARVGEIAARFNLLVSGKSCADVADTIDLGAAVIVGSGVRRAREKITRKVLAETVEAVIAAVYLDGGLGAARDLVGRLWHDMLDVKCIEVNDYKSQLQVLLQKQFRKPPEYETVSRKGAAHKPVFRIRVTSPCGATATASASSKQRAEKLAAQRLLERFNDENA